MRWNVERRLELIEFRLHWEGRLNRRDLTDEFGISAAQAAADIARYEEVAPGNLLYDGSTKSYVRTKRFKPRLINPDAADYLNELRLVAENLTERSRVHTAPPLGYLPPYARAVSWTTLRSVLAAIRGQESIDICYQSFSTPKPEWRQVAPHALGYDGIGWHVRAWCLRSEQFKNFSLARISDTNAARPSDIDPAIDHDWHQEIDITVIADPSLSAGHKRAIEIEYGMKGGKLEVRVRRSFLLYALRRLGLDVPEEVRPPHARRLKLINRDAILKIAGIEDRPITAKSGKTT